MNWILQLLQNPKAISAVVKEMLWRIGRILNPKIPCHSGVASCNVVEREKSQLKICCISRFYGAMNLCLHTSNSSEWTKAKQSVVGKACSEEWLTAWRFLHATMYFLIYVLLLQPCHKIQFRFCHQIPYWDETPCQTSHEDFLRHSLVSSQLFSLLWSQVISCNFAKSCPLRCRCILPHKNVNLLLEMARNWDLNC